MFKGNAVFVSDTFFDLPDKALSGIYRISLDEIPSLGRQTQGVRVMKLRPGDTIASLTCL